jgi:hypothetical protein
MGTAAQSRCVVASWRSRRVPRCGVDQFVIVRPHRATHLADLLPTAELVEVDDALDGHRLAWDEIDDISFVADASCYPVSRLALEHGVARVLADSGTDVLVLGGTDQSWCYVLTPEGAERLASSSGSIAERLAGSLALDPPLVIAAHDPIEVDDPSPGGNQLDLLLAYDGAVDTAPGWRHLHDDILVVPCWTRAFCDALVEAAVLADAWDHDSDDPVPGHEVSLGMISPRLTAGLHAHWVARIWPVIRQVWPLVDFAGFADAFVIRYSPDTVPDLRAHHDVGQVSASIKLNDRYDGGDLVFPRQGVSNANVPVGAAVIWPSLVTHPHRADPVTAGTKLSVTVWTEIPGVTRRVEAR